MSLRRLVTRQRRRWAIVTSAPGGQAGAQWGDTWFAHDLAEALEELGEAVRVVARGGATAPARDEDDVIVVLRGLRAVQPRRAPGRRQAWLQWVISHPELVDPGELTAYDAVFAASTSWAPSGADVEPLLQATNPRRFRPDAARADSGEAVLFVGSTRGVRRPIVEGALACGAELGVYGVGWETLLPTDVLRGSFLPNRELPAAYAAAGIVLNDHWPDMAANGFLSNRLFDAVACAARVVSDPAVGLDEVFGDSVRVVDRPEDLTSLLSPDGHRRFLARDERLAAAKRVAREHSFVARAAVLRDRAVAVLDRQRRAR